MHGKTPSVNGVQHHGTNDFDRTLFTNQSLRLGLHGQTGWMKAMKGVATNYFTRFKKTLVSVELSANICLLGFQLLSNCQQIYVCSAFNQLPMSLSGIKCYSSTECAIIRTANGTLLSIDGNQVTFLFLISLTITMVSIRQTM